MTERRHQVLHALPAIASLAIYFLFGSSQSFAQNVLLDDNFTSFALGTNWEIPNYLVNQPSNLTFLGAPNVNLGIGFSGLRMTSAQTSLQSRAIGTTRTFQLQNGTVEVDFLTGKFSDPGLYLPAGTNDFNIDAVINAQYFLKI
jgi:hypothetical protein